MTSLHKLIGWYATLSIDTLPDLSLFYAPTATFKDPFNEVSGIPAIQNIFVHMFDSTENPRFVFIDTIEQNQQAFVTWHFMFRLHGREYTVKGGSHLRFDETGLIIEHRDYWDAAEELWQKLPLVGVPVRWLRGKFIAKIK